MLFPEITTGSLQLTSESCLEKAADRQQCNTSAHTQGHWSRYGEVHFYDLAAKIPGSLKRMRLLTVTIDPRATEEEERECSQGGKAPGPQL